ncbi:hypothetical protein M422DRAFT_246839 [Sphaerobolus stellatus SS14]|nr:hypothetical protein M422DRAFT_246839 [Sphaerobolus stellatus SS14]
MLTVMDTLAAKPCTTAAAAVTLTSCIVITPYDNDTSDSYIDTSFTSPHLIATMDATGPNVVDFPIPTVTLLDIGCPSTVINTTFADCLRLKQFPLLPEKDNLLSLSETPLSCKEYVKLRLRLGNGSWVSGMFRAKLRPPPQITLENTPAPALAGYMLPQLIMAMVCDCIEVLAYQELLQQKDIEYKQKYADRFPICLLDTIDIPDHIYHCIQLGDHNEVIKGRGYHAPKKFHDSWKILLDKHLAAGCICPSSSEHSSPSFCVPKLNKGTSDYDVLPHWVNDLHELNENTIQDSSPLPCMDDILSACGRGKIFGKPDMMNSFFHT